jgi:uncharacterized protein (TIGR01777 family)
VGGGNFRCARGCEPRGRIDRRPALDRCAEAAHSRQPRASDTQPLGRNPIRRRSSGYYGPLGDESVTEEAPGGSDFLAQVCKRWEEEALAAASDRTRVVRIRTGIVLDRRNGALPQMLPPFRFGAGGPVGSGRQYWPWIHRDDWIALVRWTIVTPRVSGPFNGTAPHPVSNATFARALGRAMHRPAFMPAPGFALRLLLGEMADALLLSGQNAVPANALCGGFQFRYSHVDEALRAIFVAP